MFDLVKKNKSEENHQMLIRSRPYGSVLFLW